MGARLLYCAWISGSRQSKVRPHPGKWICAVLVLGIETSCDETAAAVVSDAGAPNLSGPGARIRSSIVLSQIAEHRPYEGVVPEIAARSHLTHLDGVICRALEEARASYADLDGVAATGGPGLIGGVMVGVMTAKAIAAVHEIPFIAVNHLEGHALTERLTGDLEFPFLLLLVSGGHCQILVVDGVGRYTRLGTTIDDALGEAFDKTAKLLGLPFPGGPAVERAGEAGDPKKFALPRPMLGRPGCHFSFSGLKTAVRRHVEALGTPSERDVADIAAGFQAAAADVVIDRIRHALVEFRARHAGRTSLVVAGGVAANGTLRARLAEFAAGSDVDLRVPPRELCTDNAAMIAWAGLERLKLGLTDPMDFKPRPRWPLDPNAEAAPGAGVKA
jgi:N6-L-threonylcarbamoyladenine synthase